jgi:ADP-ribose pyrophosphatase
MVPLLDVDRVILVRQWRNAVGRALLEIPAGCLAPGEELMTCAERELMEEIGFRPRRLTLLTTMMLAPGYSTEVLHVYLAEELTAEKRPHDEDERIDILSYNWHEIDELLQRGELADAKTICGLLLARSIRGH